MDNPENSTNEVVKKINALRLEISKTDNSEENPRAKALVITKLQEAELWATNLYSPEKLS